jgi:hypothetical protein
MGDGSIDVEDDSIDMGYLVTLPLAAASATSTRFSAMSRDERSVLSRSSVM